MSIYPTSLPDLVDAITDAWVRLNTTLDTIDDDTATGVTDANDWTPRDHVANLIAWERSMLFLLQQRPRYEGLGVSREQYLSENVDGINEVIRSANQDRSWMAVRSELEDNHAAFMSLLSTLTWDDLHLPYSHFLPDEPGDESGDPIVYWVYGNTVRHFDEHREWIEELLSARP